LDAAYRIDADGVFRACNAMHVDGRRRPPRNEFVAMADIHDRLYDRPRVFCSTFHVPGRKGPRIWISISSPHVSKGSCSSCRNSHFRMDAQSITVLIILLAALAFGGVILTRKVRAFSAKKSCDADCGCSASKQK